MPNPQREKGKNVEGAISNSVEMYNHNKVFLHSQR